MMLGDLNLDFNLTFWDVASILRVLLYLWVALTAFSIAQLYRDGLAYRVKKSPMLNSLVNILIGIAIMFLYSAIIVITQLLGSSIYYILIFFLPIFIVPLCIFLTMFRKESLREKQEHDS